MEQIKRSCSVCTFHHPERAKKPCSVFGRCVNTGGCSAYIHDKTKEEDHAKA